MKKLILASSLAALLTPAAFADTVLGVYAGAGQWKSDYDGKAGEPSITLDDLGVKEHNNNFFYIALEHPVPIIPNIRLETIDIKSRQSSDISKTFIIDGTPYTAGDHVTSEFDLSHTDVTLYYEILDNWLNLDLGITARKFDGFVWAESTTSSRKVKIDDTLPMLYAKFQFDLPFSGLSAGVDVNYVSYSGDKVSDYSAKVSYLFDSVLDIGLEGGYRKLSVTVDDDDLKANLDLKGPYVALIAHF